MAGDKQDYDLLIEMRTATRRSHNIANALILSKLVLVLTDKRLYAQALSSFLPVYSKLEALLQQHKDVPGLSTVVAVTSTIPARTAAMEQDLAYLLGPNWRSYIPSSQAAAAYAAHLEQLAAANPVLLLPYAFSLYVPILLGFMARRIQKSLALPEGQGLEFFTIPDKAGKLAQLRAAVTHAGGELPSQQLRQSLLAEAVEQFRRNNAVVAEFRVGWRAVLHAALLVLRRSMRYAVVAAAVVVGLLSVAAAAGVLPAGLFARR
ncbi:hypothetical protein OEZ86_003119 [Tetradesmus obliquus]|uniref:Uncharacterized protein n=2 Tax=Tetradesmus obliquus TaxID=3088 RepID=A0ABY8TWM0_TETOB|nr:hypothetical protein OEZ85_012209 [Tetradesmus obliquus]WIA32273.1 hypothetical protein OEZ86_003119 [Tetradesmus obliquus]|eukprot:jgi/Sobl393_1/11118/SZX74625.1